MQEQDQFDQFENKADEVEVHQDATATAARDYLADHVASGFEKPTQVFQDFKNDTDLHRDATAAEDLSRFETEKMAIAPEADPDKVAHDIEKDLGVKPEEFRNDTAVKPEEIHHDFTAKPEESKEATTADDKLNAEKAVSADIKPETAVAKPDEQQEHNVTNDQKPEMQTDRPEEQKDAAVKPEELQNDTAANDTAEQAATSLQDDQNPVDQAETQNVTAEPQEDVAPSQDEFEQVEVQNDADPTENEVFEDNKPEVTNDDDDDVDVVGDTSQKNIEQHSVDDSENSDKTDQISTAEKDAQAIQDREEPVKDSAVDADGVQQESPTMSQEDIQAAFDKATSGSPDNDYSFGQDFLSYYDTDKGFLSNLSEFFVSKIKNDQEDSADKRENSDSDTDVDNANWSDVMEDFGDWISKGTVTAVEDVIDIVKDLAQGDFVEAAKDFLHLLVDAVNMPAPIRDSLNQLIDQIPGSNVDAEAARNDVENSVSEEINNIAGDIENYAPDTAVEDINPSVQDVGNDNGLPDITDDITESAVDAAEAGEGAEAAAEAVEAVEEIAALA